MRYSFIVPVYKLSDEVDELLQSSLKQTLGDFEVLVYRRWFVCKIP